MFQSAPGAPRRRPFSSTLLSSVAFAVWRQLLKHNPVGVVAAFNFLAPVFGVGLSAIFLGESFLRWSNLAALVLVCGGIWLVTRPSPVPPATPQT